MGVVVVTVMYSVHVRIYAHKPVRGLARMYVVHVNCWAPSYESYLILPMNDGRSTGMAL